MTSKSQQHGAFGSLEIMIEHLQQAFRDQIRQLTSNNKDPWTLAREFIGAIDWSERWLQAILAMHAGLLALVLCCRRNQAVQIGVFLFAALAVFFAEPINALGAEYWEDFARQPYFDKRGAFYSGVVSVPLVLIMLVVVVNLVSGALTDMVMLKREQMHRRRIRAERTKLA
jgi:transmembrane protein 18